MNNPCVNFNRRHLSRIIFECWRENYRLDSPECRECPWFPVCEMLDRFTWLIPYRISKGKG